VILHFVPVPRLLRSAFLSKMPISGHDAGAEDWATTASLIETCKLNAVDPFDYLTATVTAIVNGHRQNQIGAVAVELSVVSTGLKCTVGPL
jgi:hypothetical protein